MPEDEHVEIINRSSSIWNEWRRKNPGIRPNLSKAGLYGTLLGGANLYGADLRGADLRGADLRKADLGDADLAAALLRGAGLDGANLFKANLHGADLHQAHLHGAKLGGASLHKAKLGGADLHEADLRGADLRRADLYGANLRRAKLREAKLHEAKLGRADLGGADLTEATLVQANLAEATLVQANLTGASLTGVNLNGADLANADLTGCRIYSISAWGLKLSEGTKQKNLIITGADEPDITVENIEVAQFIYLMLRNEKICDIIDTITSKAVLILGRFTPERKAVLDALREELRRRNYLPILFDFEKSASRDITETISLLARMARFVLADITDARSIPQELNVIVPDLPSVPVQPLLLEGSGEYGMFDHYTRYPWVLPLHRYTTQDQLITELGERVIKLAERRAIELHPGIKQVP